jgi:hypothetical protein
LKERGLLTEEEFAAAKQAILETLGRPILHLSMEPLRRLQAPERRPDVRVAFDSTTLLRTARCPNRQTFAR